MEDLLKICFLFQVVSILEPTTTVLQRETPSPTEAATKSRMVINHTDKIPLTNQMIEVHIMKDRLDLITEIVIGEVTVTEEVTVTGEVTMIDRITDLVMATDQTELQANHTPLEMTRSLPQEIMTAGNLKEW